jgi:hypothetical protein
MGFIIKKIHEVLELVRRFHAHPLFGSFTCIELQPCIFQLQGILVLTLDQIYLVIFYGLVIFFIQVIRPAQRVIGIHRCLVFLVTVGFISRTHPLGSLFQKRDGIGLFPLYIET